MTQWILVMVVYSLNASGMTSVMGFKSEESCNKAGISATTLQSSTTKFYKFVCIKQE